LSFAATRPRQVSWRLSSRPVKRSARWRRPGKGSTSVSDLPRCPSVRETTAVSRVEGTRSLR
jgi:hypothetical protein